jgi:fermentation-respiration switch protein FrsA (DUF1100 family)
MGRSLGGAVSIYMASQAEHIFRGLIVENSFTSISDMADSMFPFLKPIKPFILKIGWNSDQLVPKITMPVYYVTGNKDEIVPHEHTLKLHELTTSAVFKDLYVVDGGEHNDSWYVGGTTYLERLHGFMNKCMTSYQLPQFDDWHGGQISDLSEDELNKQ